MMAKSSRVLRLCIIQMSRMTLQWFQLFSEEITLLCPPKSKFLFKVEISENSSKKIVLLNKKLLSDLSADIIFRLNWQKWKVTEDYTFSTQLQIKRKHAFSLKHNFSYDFCLVVFQIKRTSGLISYAGLKGDVMTERSAWFRVNIWSYVGPNYSKCLKIGEGNA